MKKTFLYIVVIVSLAGIIYLIYPFLLARAWGQYKIKVGSEKYCFKHKVEDCPPECDVTKKSVLDLELGCHMKINFTQ